MREIHDAGVRQKALDTGNSYIVQAPAGSGKTELLIQRYLKLLSEVARPEQIIAMTFTRKAAAEMRSRIFRALERAVDNRPPESPHEFITWQLAQKALSQDALQKWRLLDNPQRLKVQTIDSFCSSLTKQTPLISGIGAVLDIEEKSRDLYRETAHRVLKLAEQDSPVGQAVRSILTRLDNSKSDFLNRVVHLLEKRDQWMLSFSETGNDNAADKAAQELRLKGLVESILHEVHEAIPQTLKQELPSLARYSGSNLHAEDSKHPLSCLRDLEVFPKPVADQLDQWRALAKLLTTDKDFRKPRGVSIKIGFPDDKTDQNKPRFQKLLESYQGATDLFLLLKRIEKLPDPAFTQEEWKFLESMLFLLPRIAGILRDVFRENGKTDFSEVALSARRALGSPLEPSDLLLKLDMKIQHLLVDEFQDTSFKQIELLKLLTEGWEPEDGRTLFIVGDPMQSIYKFRDALVGLFIHVQKRGLADSHPLVVHSLKLTTNFRSQENVVSWFNRCFAAIMPPLNDPDRGAITFSESEAFQKESLDPGVVYHPIANSKSQEEAQRVVETIQSIQQSHPEASIAILVRARTHLEEIVGHLQKANIQIRSEAIDPLTGRSDIQDLLVLLRALLSKADRVAWLSILRAPWCGISLKDLHTLCLGEPTTLIWELINSQEKLESISSKGRQRIERLVHILQPALDCLGTAGFREILEGAWVALGGPACITSRSHKDIELFFDKVTEVIERDGVPGLHHFDQILQGLFASTSPGEGPTVHIMTMHKAKGLEFDFVLLPGLGKKSKPEEQQLIYWMPHGDKLLLAPIRETGGEEPPIYKFLRSINREKDNFEVQRLLYVSCTRPKLQLHLFGHTDINKDGNRKPQSDSLLAVLWPFVGKEWQELTPSDSPPGELDETESQLKATLRRLPLGFSTPEPLPPIETGTATEISLERDRPTYEWAGNQARCLGNVLHRHFKEMAEKGPAKWKSTDKSAFESNLKIALRAEGLSHLEVQQASQRGIRALGNILEDDRGQWILKDHQDSQSEFPLTYLDQNIFKNRVVDRTFVDENNVRWIIDFKTGERLGGDLEGFFREEIRRYRPQLQEYEKIFRLKGEKRAIKKALYYPLHQRFLEIPE